MMANLLKTFFLAVTSLLAHQEIEGRERVPDPPYIMAINHLGIFDVAFVFGQLGGPHISGWAAEKYEYHPIFGPLLRAGNGIFIQRGQVDRKAIQAAVTWLKNGNSFGMAPEGTRSETASLARGKTGVAYLADEAQVPVVPGAITGTERIGSNLLRLQRSRLTCRLGEPFLLPSVSDDDRMADLRRNTDEVMCRIAAMLPPAYRGYYADHPRTQQLLDGGYGHKPTNDNAP